MSQVRPAMLMALRRPSALKLAAVVMMAATLPGCATLQPLPEDVRYVPPEVGEPSADIVATIVESKVPLFDDFNTYVFAVEKKIVDAQRGEWHRPVALRAGQRTITATFRRGLHVAFADLNFFAAEGRSYQLKSICKEILISGEYIYCDFWVVDKATQGTVSELVRGKARMEHPLRWAPKPQVEQAAPIAR